MKGFTNIDKFEGLVAHDDVIKDYNKTEVFTTSIQIANKFGFKHNELLDDIDKLRLSEAIDSSSRHSLKPEWCKYDGKTAFRINHVQFYGVIMMLPYISNVTHESELMDYFNAFNREKEIVNNAVRAEIRVRWLSMWITRLKEFIIKRKIN